MDFFTKEDWLGRSAPYAFKFDHLLFLIIGLGLGVLLAILLMKKKQKTINIWLISLWGFGTLVEIIYYTTLFIICVNLSLFNNERPTTMIHKKATGHLSSSNHVG